MGSFCCKPQESVPKPVVYKAVIPEPEPEPEHKVVTPVRPTSFKSPKRLTSLPRYPQSRDICHSEDQIDRSKSLLVFFSHCWLRGSGVPPHPDTVKDEKLQLVIEATEHLRRLAPGMMDIYVWIDYGCTSQSSDIDSEWRQLDKVIKACDLVLTATAGSYDSEWDIPPQVCVVREAYKAKAWSDGPNAYLNRCWCRLEVQYAASTPLSDEDSTDRVNSLTGGPECALVDGQRPHYIYGLFDKEREGLPRVLPPLKSTFFDNCSPETGPVSSESGRKRIKELVELLQPCIELNNSAGYTGERNQLGQPHGRGTCR